MNAACLSIYFSLRWQLKGDQILHYLDEVDTLEDVDMDDDVDTELEVDTLTINKQDP